MTTAAITFAAIMAAGYGGLAALVWRHRRPTTPATADPLDRDIWPPSIYGETVAALGDPKHIDTDALPCPPWPEAAA